MMAISETATARREELVRKHVEAENAADHEAALDTFQHPRYEYVATDEVYDGAEEVQAHWEELNRAFPDQEIEIVALHSADDAVLMEAIARGTHAGPYRGLPPTGRRFEQQFLAIFVFEGDALVGERVYFDAATILQQLGIARDPSSLTGRLEAAVSHPLTISRGLVRRVIGR
jgi:steroid delta-isomerase-like uncharacterized protein